jgi:hypothetical protein
MSHFLVYLVFGSTADDYNLDVWRINCGHVNSHWKRRRQLWPSSKYRGFNRTDNHQSAKLCTAMCSSVYFSSCLTNRVSSITLRRNMQIRSIQIICSNTGRLVRHLFQANLTNKHSVRKTVFFRRQLEDLNRSHESFTTLHYIKTRGTCIYLWFIQRHCSFNYTTKNGGLISDTKMQTTRNWPWPTVMLYRHVLRETEKNHKNPIRIAGHRV